jgi:hypothetical protein
MNEKKRSLIESYKKELADIHPALPAYFYATNGYIVPWNRKRSGEKQINQFLLEPVEPNGEVDEAVLDELIRIWAEESWFGLAVHPPLAFLLLRRKLENPSSKLRQLLYKDGVSKEVAEQSQNASNAVELQKDNTVETETKKRNKRRL